VCARCSATENTAVFPVALTHCPRRLRFRPVQMFQLAEQRLTQLMMGDKSERAQKVFALDYCASAFVTEGAPSNTAARAAGGRALAQRRPAEQARVRSACAGCARYPLAEALQGHCPAAACRGCDEGAALRREGR
jgi:hypothetical protein